MNLSLKSLLKIEKENKIAEFFLLLFIAECTIGCSGRWLEIGSLSIRMILFILAFFFSLPAVFRNIKQLAVNLQILITCCFGLYLLLCVWIGYSSGNKINFIVADVSTLLSLALFPGFVSVMCNRKALERAINTIFCSAAAMATITVLLHFIFAKSDGQIVNQINLWLNEFSLGGIAFLKTGIYRVFLKNQIFFQVAVVYGVWLLEKSAGKKRLIISIMEGLLFCGCIISYTRGFWLGLAASAVVLLLIGIQYIKIYFKSAVAMLTVFAVFLVLSSALYKGPMAVIEIVNRFDPNLIVLESPSNDALTEAPNVNEETSVDENVSVNEDVGVDENVSVNEDVSVDESVSVDENVNANDNISIDDIVDKSNQDAVSTRADTLDALFKNISEHPIIGNGLGATLDNVRDGVRTEYMYLDMLMKTGCIGMLLFLGTFFGFIFKQIYQELQRKKQKISISNWDSPQVRNRFLTAAYIGVAVTSIFNPFLNNPMGITLLMLTSTAVYEHNSKNERCKL